MGRTTTPTTVGIQPLLTEDEKKEIVRLYNEGVPVFEIGKKYGRKKDAILNVLHQRGIVMKRGRRREPPKTE